MSYLILLTLSVLVTVINFFVKSVYGQFRQNISKIMIQSNSRNLPLNLISLYFQILRIFEIRNELRENYYK